MYSKPEPPTTSYGVPLGATIVPPDKSIEAAASREAARRESGMLAALNRATPIIKPELVIREPLLPEDFASQAAKLDQTIYDRGIAIDRKRLESLGKTKFTQLLTADAECRSEQRTIGIRCDLTDWGSVFHALCNVGAPASVPVPRTKTAHQFAGTSTELDEVRVLTGFEDMWKASRSEPRAIRAIYVFRDLFESLVFGQSLLDRLSDDGRLRSHLFIGSQSHKVRYFDDWLPALQTEVHRIPLKRYSQGIAFWLSGETSKRPDMMELAKEFVGVRVPSQAQIRSVTAMFDAFLLGLSEWRTWEFVGRQTRSLPDQWVLKQWRDELRGRFRRVELFNRDLERCFLQPVGAAYQLDSLRYRRFVEQTMARLRDVISLFAALAVEEVAPGTIVARFQDRLVLQRKPPENVTEKINEKLNSAFQ